MNIFISFEYYSYHCCYSLIVSARMARTMATLYAAALGGIFRQRSGGTAVGDVWMCQEPQIKDHLGSKPSNMGRKKR